MLGFHAQGTGGISAEFRYNSIRRNLAYQNAAGSAPLAALLALNAPAEVPTAEYSWGEERIIFTTTRGLAYGSFGAFAASNGTQASTHAATVGSGALLLLKLVSINGIGTDEILYIPRLPVSGGSTSIESWWRVTALDDVNNMATVTLIALGAGTSVTIDNATGRWPATDAGVGVTPQGKAMKEGSVSSMTHLSKSQANPTNYAQIFRDARGWTTNDFNHQGFFQPEGAYAYDMRKLGRAHLERLEHAMLFGMRTKTQDSEGSITRTTGGLLWFLREWEKADGGAAQYRPGGAALTSNASAQKRILDMASTAVTRTTWEEVHLPQLQQFGTNATYDKLVLCGQAAMVKMNAAYRDEFVRNTDLKTQYDLGMIDLKTLDTPYGQLHFKTHPLMMNPNYTNDMIVVDVGNIRFVHTPGCDTRVNKNIQANDYDGVKEEFYTQGGLEVVFPENHAWVRNFGGISA